MLSLYFHIPFCNHKCFYCDFYSLGKFSNSQEENFVKSMLNEIDLSLEKFYGNQQIDTIFFGGGTPTILSPKHIEEITNKIHKHFKLSENYEWTFEANPESATKEKLKLLLDSGINRISFGAQSFNKEELVFLERIHSSEEIKEKFLLAREVGFKNLSLDLIFSIPNQKRETWLNSLKSTIELDPEHISSYSLIFEEKTKLYKKFIKGEIVPNDSEFEHDLYLETIEIMLNNGFFQYEVSNFSKLNYECRHNLNYWYGTEYLGFGPSAHSFINNQRHWNYRNLNKYNTILNQNILPIEDKEEIDLEKSITEAIYLGLRAKGINLANFKTKYNLNLLEILSNKLAYLFDNYLLSRNGLLKLTPEGYSLSDEISLKIIENII